MKFTLITMTALFAVPPLSFAQESKALKTQEVNKSKTVDEMLKAEFPQIKINSKFSPAQPSPAQPSPEASCTRGFTAVEKERGGGLQSRYNYSYAFKAFT